MTDRELLELAAKAAGIDGYFASDDQNERDEYWNPLTDDGDALRLVVKLKIEIGYLLSNEAWAKGWVSAKVFKESNELRDGTYDPCAATRLAIVRAAAEIGRAMK